MDTLDKHFRELTRAAFARHGFAQGEIAARWPEIVGEALAGVTGPGRISWPRGQGEAAQKSGGTLTVRTAPGRALETQYAVPRIIERLNGFMGYAAITQVKIVQASDWPKPVKPKVLVPAEKPVHQQQVDRVSDDGLRASLTRLGCAVAARAQGSPQGK
ncbi:DUF721 domain-containing protein [Aestuariivirga sp.]|uniref:DUF721 domain-containing protein n=1 Tax=Aestuariivirga sp. TaxID=2650926 RepID=UPI0039E3E322